MVFHPKVTAGALAGYVVAIVLAEAERRGISISSVESAGITGVMMFLAGFVAPSDPPPAGP